ncbi:MAG: hypothetical protein VW709_19605 [Rickettsiales bacterium]
MGDGRVLGVGIGGFGAIGMAVARALDAGEIDGLRLAAVWLPLTNWRAGQTS